MEYFVQGIILVWSLITLLFLILMLFLFDIKVRRGKQGSYNLTEKDLDFLIDLQHEMLTQDNVGQAAPRFWVVAGEKIVWTDADHAEGEQLINDSEVVATNFDEAVEYFSDLINGHLDEYDDYCLEIEKESNYANSYEIRKIDLSISTSTSDFIEGDNVVEVQSSISNIEELVNALEEFELIDEDEYSIAHYCTEHHVYPDTLFLTNRGCKKHIENNRHNYDKTAHSYAMTAWRSPEVEQLWSILDKIDWNAIKEKAYGTKRR
jgi:hypothetical protein